MAEEKRKYESSLIGLAKHYGNYYEDEDTQFGAEMWNHIYDPETYDMLMMQTKNGSSLEADLGDWHGRKCYDYLEGRDTPCENCYVNKIEYDNYYVCTRKNPISGKHFFIEAMRIHHCGKPAILEKVIDITNPDYKDRVIDEYIGVKNLSNTVISALMGEKGIFENFERACKEICEYFDADRALITEYCMGKLNTTYSRIPQPFTQVCTELSEEAIMNLTEATSSLNYIWVPDVPNADKLDLALREYWSSRGIQSILLIPMSCEGRFIGTVSMHNIRKHFKVIDALKLIGLAVAKCINAYVVEAKAERQLYTDPLTGALNLSGLKRRAYELFNKHPENNYYFCVMDIRYFGGINRRYGFELGDKILVETAQKLRKYMGEDEDFCRISGDVFCFLAKFPGEEAVRRRFARFTESMQCFEELTDAGHTIEYQCGSYVLDGSGCSVAQAIDRANLARLTLKDEPGSNVLFFSEELLERSKHETELLQDFKPALAHGELTVYYQPQCNYTSQKIVGAEALVRWKSPKHGNVSPADFIPLLERHGMIHELDMFVWEEVCRYQQKWMEMGYECPISVNVSRHDMLGHNICGELCALLEKYNIPKKLLPLEITETAYIKNSEELIYVVDMLKAAGFTVEMDDFGSGYSSLNALKDVSVDLLKLDMKFLDMGDKTGKGSSILNCIVRMTRWLNLAVLAEGVETKEQAEYLKNIGCDLMQGYYFARPMPADDFENMLKKNGTEKSVEGETESIHPDKFMESLMSNPLLFNNMGPAAIAEYTDGKVEGLMVNDSFLEMLEITREDYMPYMKNMAEYAQNILYSPEALDHYIDSANGMRTRECYLKRKDGSARKVRVYRREILRGVDRSIVLICLDDISELSLHERAKQAD